MTAHAGAGHETRDVDARAIGWAGLGLAVAVPLVLWGMWALLGHYRARAAREGPGPTPLAGVAVPRRPPEPRLQTHPLRDMAALRAEEDLLLDGYAWVDRRAGIVRIPIERAMALLAARAAAGEGAP
jgi:hypothetical protein